MIYNIGNVCLILLIVISAINTINVVYRNKLLNKTTYGNTYLQFIVVTIALLKLIEAYITTDYNYNNVALNTHKLVPLIYRFSGVWGNHEGSMLLIIWLLCLINMIFLLQTKFENKKHILSLQSFIVLLITAFTFLVSNPFEISNLNIKEGQGFNPLLQDYTLVIHPPILYYGYIGLSIPFSALISGLQNKKINSRYIAKIYPWIFIPWGLLSLGIALGSWWAYRELGWGGFWFWDPVENVSLVVWCASASFLHMSKLTIKTHTFYRWTIFLGLITFILALLSLTLVRSGALVSVHSFAVDSNKGFGLLMILCAITSLATYTYMKHYKTLPSHQHTLSLFNKASGIVLNNVFVMTTCLVILLALLYPVFFGLISGKLVSVGELFYKDTLEFVFLPVIFLMITFPFLDWKKKSLKKHIKPLGISLCCALLFVITINYLRPIVKLSTNLYIFAATSAIISCILYLIKKPLPARIPMHLGHIGFLILILGAALCWTWQTEDNYLVKEKQEYSISTKHQIILSKVSYIKGSNYLSRIASIKLYRNNILLGTATPETRFYPIENTFTHESSIIHSLTGDIYFTLGEFSSDQRLSIKIKYKPFVYLIWCGSVLMTLSAFLYLVVKKKDENRHY